ncbi:MAG TPA: proline dehydrogenase family protein [Vicinamibacterales bacterium]|nr:proline dehydrogenase family protein [Vicinamibacterales bacterium]
MSIMRSLLLAGAESAWLRRRATRAPFVRRSVSRFMPGETMEEALEACRGLEAEQGAGSILTHLGENVASLAEATAVTAHYLELIDRIQGARLDAHVSVKLTQLGLDLGAAQCLGNMETLVDRAAQAGNMVWIDMESSKYVDATIEIFRHLRARSGRVGLCLQAYLRRTAADLDTLLPLGVSIRLVKGAYREPPDLAFPRKADVDENYRRLALRFFDPALPPGTFLGIATHDARLVEQLGASAAAGRYEFEMLYGIARPLQAMLARHGIPLRVLVSYGAFWFPWYMRRLAERPANTLFVARSLLRG